MFRQTRHGGYSTHGEVDLQRKMYFSIEHTSNWLCNITVSWVQIFPLLPHLRGVKLKRTVDAGRHARKNDSCVAFEALCPTINERNNGTWVQDAVLIHQQRQLHRQTEGLCLTATFYLYQIILYLHPSLMWVPYNENKRGSQKEGKKQQGLHCRKLTSMPFIHLLATIESSPQTIIWNSRERHKHRSIWS